MMTVFRKATEQDRTKLSQLIVNAFGNEFSMITKNLDTVAVGMETSFLIHHFFVLENEGELVGAISVCDCDERAYNLDKKAFKKHFGWVRGTLSASFMANEFMAPISYPKSTCYIENVAVAENARRMGFATKLLEGLIQNTSYNEYILDVMSNNDGAKSCYENFGFKLFTPVPPAKASKNKVYMRYKPQNR